MRFYFPYCRAQMCVKFEPRQQNENAFKREGKRKSKMNVCRFEAMEMPSPWLNLSQKQKKK